MTPTYRPGQYFVVRSTGWVAWLIRTITQSSVNHAGIVVDETGRTLEARKKGADYFQVPPGALLIDPPLTDAQRGKIPFAAATIKNRRYSYFGVVVLGLSRLGLRSKWLDSLVGRITDQFCSQVVDYAEYLSDFRLFQDGRAFGSVTPGDLLDAAERNGWPIVAVA